MTPCIQVYTKLSNEHCYIQEQKVIRIPNTYIGMSQPPTSLVQRRMQRLVPTFLYHSVLVPNEDTLLMLTYS